MVSSPDCEDNVRQAIGINLWPQSRAGNDALAWVLFLIILGFNALQMRASRWVHYEGAEEK